MIHGLCNIADALFIEHLAVLKEQEVDSFIRTCSLDKRKYPNDLLPVHYSTDASHYIECVFSSSIILCVTLT